MIKDNFFKASLYSKKALILWLIIIGQIYICQKYNGIYDVYTFEYLYLNVAVLFAFSIIIFEYLFYISMYMINYMNYYVITRCGSVKEMKRQSRKSIFILTTVFVFGFNIINYVIVRIIYNPQITNESIKYMGYTILLQLLAFFIMGEVYNIIFFKIYDVRISMLVLWGSFLYVVKCFDNKIDYLLLPDQLYKDIAIGNLINLFSILILLVIFNLHSKDRLKNFYEKDR